MDQVQTQESYLSKAREAEHMAEKAKSVVARDTWHKVAQTYRDLARFAQKGYAI